MIINSLSPKRLFRSKKHHSAVSCSDPSSFGSGTASSSSSDSFHKLVSVDGDSAFLAFGGLASLSGLRVWLAGDTVFRQFQILHLILFEIFVHLLSIEMRSIWDRHFGRSSVDDGVVLNGSIGYLAGDSRWLGRFGILFLILFWILILLLVREWLVWRFYAGGGSPFSMVRSKVQRC